MNRRDTIEELMAAFITATLRMPTISNGQAKACADAAYNLLSKQKEDDDKLYEAIIKQSMQKIDLLSKEISEKDYWKQRCEAAEAVINFDDSENPEYVSNEEDVYKKWKKLKESEPTQALADYHKSQKEERTFVLQDLFDCYKAGEAAGDFDRKRKQRGLLKSTFFKTKFNVPQVGDKINYVAGSQTNSIDKK